MIIRTRARNRSRAEGDERIARSKVAEYGSDCAPFSRSQWQCPSATVPVHGSASTSSARRTRSASVVAFCSLQRSRHVMGLPKTWPSSSRGAARRADLAGGGRLHAPARAKDASATTPARSKSRRLGRSRTIHPFP
jgi:hypothetical protein